MDGYDIIGDVHGNADKLHELLMKMDYKIFDGTYCNPNRKAIFVGDFIDRGNAQIETLEIARRMVQRGRALAVMGNHEYNALAWHTEDPDCTSDGTSDDADGYLRPHTTKKREQHKAFLDAFQGRPSMLADYLDWFWELPLFLELPELRVVHACWDPKHIQWISTNSSSGNRLTKDLLIQSSRKGTDAHSAIETVLKGPEVELPGHCYFLDKYKHKRRAIRVRWWDKSRTTYKRIAMLEDEQRDLLPDTPIRNPDVVPGYQSTKPVFFGHYWNKGIPAPIQDNVACVDYSAGDGGPLVAYRWSGEQYLAASHFVSTAQI